MANQYKNQIRRAWKALQKKPAIILVIVLVCVLIIVLLQNNTAEAPAKTHQQLTNSLQASLGRTDGLDVKFDPKTGLATVIQTEQTEHPEISAQTVRIAYGLLVKMGREMFAIDGVKSLQVTEKVQVNFPKDPDQEFLPPEAQATRPSETTEVVTITMTKTNFNSIDWDAQKGQPIHKLITEKATNYTINPELKPQLKDEELYLELH